MRAFRDLPIGRKLTFLILIIVSVVLLLTTTAFVYNDVRMIKSTRQGQVLTLAEVLGANSEVPLAFNDKDEAEKALRSLRQDPTIQLGALYDAGGKVLASYKAPKVEGSVPAAPGLETPVFTSEGYLEVFRPVMRETERLGTVYVRADMESLHAQMRAYAVIAAVVFAVSLGVSLLLAYGLQRVISRPIGRLAQAIDAVSKQADYSIRVEKTSNDELGVLSDGFNSMLSQIQHRGGELERTNAELTQRGSELERFNAELDKTVQLASKVAKAAQVSAEIGKDGRKAVEDSMGAMTTVQQHVQSIAGNILTLAEKAQAIGKIIATVNDIAEQINVLALNAALEASRAGIHGRGFAVVANVVKTLAEQSKKATADVRQILGVIQKTTHQAVLSTEQGTKAATTAAEVVAQAGETIKTLSDTLASTAQVAAQIVASAAQQGGGTYDPGSVKRAEPAAKVPALV